MQGPTGDQVHSDVVSRRCEGTARIVRDREMPAEHPKLDWVNVTPAYSPVRIVVLRLQLPPFRPLFLLLLPEMGTTTAAGMMDGPPSVTAPTQSRIAQPGHVRWVSSRGSLVAEEDGNSGEGEKGRNPSSSQNSTIAGVRTWPP